MTTAVAAPAPAPSAAALLRPRAPADRAAWAVVAAGAAGLTAALAWFWGANPGYADRFLILAGAGYAAYVLAPGWAAVPVRPRPVLGLAGVLVGAVLFPLAGVVLLRVGPRPILLWALAAAVLAAAGGLVLARLGWARLRAAAFPLLFPLFALPVPGLVLGQVQEPLQEVTTRVAGEVLRGVGMTAEREGFVLALPGGRLRVEEACSGVRSLTALTAIAGFVAFLNGFGPARGALLVALAVPVVAAVNVVRVVLSGLIQEGFGSEYIRDDWHEGLGLAMVLVGLGLILALSQWVGGPGREPAPAAPAAPAAGPARGGWGPAVVLAAGAAATAFGWAAVARDADSGPHPVLADIAPTLGEWAGQDQKVEQAVTDLLAPDQAVHRRYVDNLGREAIVWVLYWRTGLTVKGYHHPDVCWPTKGFEESARWVEPVPVAGGPAVPATAREFAQPNKLGERHVLLFWTQDGPRVWTDEDERAASAEGIRSVTSGRTKALDLLTGTSHGGRLSVVVVVPYVGASARPSAQRAAAGLARQVAAEVYRVCPWAAPGRPD